MTNYEYLVKTGKLAKFLDDCCDPNVLSQAVYHTYNVRNNGSEYTFGEDIADFLQAEHSTTTYIKMSDVVDALNETLNSRELDWDVTTFAGMFHNTLFEKEQKEIDDAEIH